MEGQEEYELLLQRSLERTNVLCQKAEMIGVLPGGTQLGIQKKRESALPNPRRVKESRVILGKPRTNEQKSCVTNNTVDPHTADSTLDYLKRLEERLLDRNDRILEQVEQLRTDREAIMNKIEERIQKSVVDAAYRNPQSGEDEWRSPTREHHKRLISHACQEYSRGSDEFQTGGIVNSEEVQNQVQHESPETLIGTKDPPRFDVSGPHSDHHQCGIDGAVSPGNMEEAAVSSDVGVRERFPEARVIDGGVSEAEGGAVSQDVGASERFSEARRTYSVDYRDMVVVECDAPVAVAREATSESSICTPRPSIGRVGDGTDVQVAFEVPEETDMRLERVEKPSDFRLPTDAFRKPDRSSPIRGSGDARVWDLASSLPVISFSPLLPGRDNGLPSRVIDRKPKLALERLQAVEDPPHLRPLSNTTPPMSLHCLDPTLDVRILQWDNPSKPIGDESSIQPIPVEESSPIGHLPSGRSSKVLHSPPVQRIQVRKPLGLDSINQAKGLEPHPYIEPSPDPKDPCFYSQVIPQSKTLSSLSKIEHVICGEAWLQHEGVVIDRGPKNELPKQNDAVLEISVMESNLSSPMSMVRVPVSVASAAHILAYRPHSGICIGSPGPSEENEDVLNLSSRE